jgi:hypothetical protein
MTGNVHLLAIMQKSLSAEGYHRVMTEWDADEALATVGADPVPTGPIAHADANRTITVGLGGSSAAGPPGAGSAEAGSAGAGSSAAGRPAPGWPVPSPRPVIRWPAMPDR